MITLLNVLFTNVHFIVKTSYKTISKTLQTQQKHDLQEFPAKVFALHTVDRAPPYVFYFSEHFAHSTPLPVLQLKTPYLKAREITLPLHDKSYNYDADSLTCHVH